MNRVAFLLFFFIISSLAPAQTQTSHVWSAKLNGTGDFSDKFNCMTTDNTGNIYLGGYTVNIGQNRDFLTMKLNPSGNPLWTAQFNGPGNGADEVQAIEVDGAGNVYVTGFQKGNGTGDDFLTIKYNSLGDTLWTRVYNFIANEDDVANSIAINSNGDVFVAGQSDNNPASLLTNDDFVTIKYNSAGAQQWAKRYNGIGDGTDRAVKVLADAGGNCYVTGRTFNGSDDDYLTIKYNSAGTQQWMTTYDSGSGDDRATAMAMDGTGNLYVTGRKANGSNDDYGTVKYNSAGAEQWIRNFDYVDNDRPTAITLDASGNIYVTGQSDSDPLATKNYDYLTVKYNSAAVQQWAQRYNGTGNGEDIPTAIAVDASGNAYVTGESDMDPSAVITNKDYATIQYNSAGTLQWVKTYNGSDNAHDGAAAIVLNNSGNILVTGGSQNGATQKDAVTVCYSSSGSEIWVKTFAGVGDNSDNANAMTTDASGNIYLAGYSVSIDQDRDMCTLKMNNLGDTLWVRKYNGTSSFVDEANDIVVDAAGFVYVTGFTKNSGVSNDFTTIKYNSSGDSLWVRKYNSPYSNSDKATGIDVDASGNLYVTGYSKDATDMYDDIVTIKYSTTGVQQWVVRYNGTGNLDDKAVAIKAVPSANIYVAGKSNNGTDADCILIKYNSSGTLQWLKTYDSGNGDDEVNAMIVDNSENIYLTGSARHAGGLEDDVVTLKYNYSGTQQWAKTYNGTESSDDVAYGIALDNTSNVIVTGKSVIDTTGGTKNYDYLTVKYDAAGIEQWAKNYNGQANTDDIATAIVTDNSGNIYITGESESGISTSPNKDYVTIKYDALGNMNWYGVYNGAGDGTDSPNAIAFNNGKVYVTGGSLGVSSQKDILTLEYNSVVGIDEYTSQNSLLNIYPNPAENVLYVKSTDKDNSKPLEICITDCMGRKAAGYSINNKTEALDISKINPGLYLLYCNKQFAGKLEIIR